MFKQLFLLLAALTLLAAPAFAGVTYQVSPDGYQVEVFIEDVNFEGWIQSLPMGVTITACLNSTSTYGIDWDWTIDGQRNGPGFDIIGGFIDGTICDAPNWDVTSGRITGTTLQLNAVYVGSGNCADELDMSGTRSGGPRIWSGDYGFPAHAFPHDTALVGLGPCQ